MLHHRFTRVQTNTSFRDTTGKPKQPDYVFPAMLLSRNRKVTWIFQHDLGKRGQGALRGPCRISPGTGARCPVGSSQLSGQDLVTPWETKARGPVSVARGLRAEGGGVGRTAPASTGQPPSLPAAHLSSAAHGAVMTVTPGEALHSVHLNDVWTVHGAIICVW